MEEATALNRQIIDLCQQGRYEEAISRDERALAIREEVLSLSIRAVPHRE